MQSRIAPANVRSAAGASWRSAGRQLRLSLGTALLLATGGCKDDAEPCLNFELGARYELELVERDEDPYNAGMTDEGCGPDFDVAVGDRIGIGVEQLVFDDPKNCWAGWIVPTNPSAHGWEEVQHAVPPTGLKVLFQSDFAARIGDCDGHVVLAVQAYAGSLFEPSVRGARPSFTLVRGFAPSGSCRTEESASCSDLFAITIHPVE